MSETTSGVRRGVIACKLIKSDPMCIVGPVEPSSISGSLPYPCTSCSFDEGFVLKLMLLVSLQRHAMSFSTRKLHFVGEDILVTKYTMGQSEVPYFFNH